MPEASGGRRSATRWPDGQLSVTRAWPARRATEPTTTAVCGGSGEPLATTPPGRTGEWIVAGLGCPAPMTTAPPTAAAADSAATAPMPAGDFAPGPAHRALPGQAA